MAKRVRVPALKPLTYQGRSYVRGEIVAMLPVDASIAARRGDVTLAIGAVVARDPEPEPEPEMPRRRRTYRRRDLVAEGTE